MVRRPRKDNLMSQPLTLNAASLYAEQMKAARVASETALDVVFEGWMNSGMSIETRDARVTAIYRREAFAKAEAESDYRMNRRARCAAMGEYCYI